jgi:hypothetical protein
MTFDPKPDPDEQDRDHDPEVTSEDPGGQREAELERENIDGDDSAA